MNSIINVYPLIAMRGLTIFPGNVVSFDVAREISIAAVKKAIEGDRTLFLTAQKNLKTEHPPVEELYNTGTVAIIKQVVKASGEGFRITVEGLFRARIIETYHYKTYYTATVEELNDEEVSVSGNELEAIIRLAQDSFDTYASLIDRIPPEVIMSVIDESQPGRLADYIAGNSNFKVIDYQTIIEMTDPVKRLEKVISLLSHENDILALEANISDKVRDAMDRNQRDYYIREQIKQLSEELGIGDDPLEESFDYVEKIERLCVPEESKAKLLKEAHKIGKMPVGSHDAAVLRTHLDTILEMPWGVLNDDRYDVCKVKKMLDRDHHGLEKVKERIVEFIAVKQLAPEVKCQIICLVGPPGTGKTSIAQSIAEAINRKLVRISLGGIRDEAEIRGHRKTYIGAMPGRIAEAIKQSKTFNPLIVFDEIDKLTKDMNGDPSSALLEVFDTEQNYAFRDNYMEIPIDLSNVMFIATANNPDTIPEPLRDRMEIIEITSYTAQEKFDIAKKHLVPKELKKHGLSAKNMKITDDALDLLIRGYTREAGVRELQRKIASLCRKTAHMIASNDVKKVIFKANNIDSFIGPAKYLDDYLAVGDNVGIVNGLAWTAVGGEVLQVEVNILPGDGKIELTGSLGDVMKESAKSAISYIRSNTERYGIDIDFYKKHDIHIHFPDGATPKDGPSAGIAITTAVISGLTGKAVSGDIAMTGEITIRGRVLPIGGLKEKSMAAYKNGKKTVIIPATNMPDLHDVDTVVKDNVKFIPVTNYEDVARIAIINKTAETKIERSELDSIPVIKRSIMQTSVRN